MSAFEISAEEFRRLGYRAVDLLAERLASVRTDPVRAPVPDDDRRGWIDRPLPIEPTSADILLDEIARSVLTHPMGNASPRFFAWVNSPPAPLGIVAELLAAGLNPSVAGGDHAATYIEHGVLGWLKTIMRQPGNSGAVLTSGGSVATLVGLGVMRHVKSEGEDRARGLQSRDRSMVVYTSTQGHSCIQKAVEILGFGSDHLRRIPVDDEYRMDVAALERQLAADRAAGLVTRYTRIGSVTDTRGLDQSRTSADVHGLREKALNRNQ